MAKEAIDRIGEAEEKAAQIIKKAEEKAATSQKEAANAAAEYLRQEKEKCSKQAADAINVARKESERLFAQILEEYDQACAAVQSAAEKNMPWAVELILGSIGEAKAGG